MSFSIRRFLYMYTLEIVVFIVVMLYGSRLYASDFADYADVSWMKHLAIKNKARSVLAYPVNEINIHINLGKSISKSRIYTLNVYIPDLYHLFCLKEVLKQQKIKYYLKNQGNNVKLLVYLSKKQNIELLVKSLKARSLKINVLSNQEEK